MSWFTDMFQRRAASAITFPTPTGDWGKVDLEATLAANFPQHFAPKARVVQRIGGFEVVESKEGVHGVMFDTFGECRVFLVCDSRPSAIYLATALDLCALEAYLDAGLERVAA